MTGKVTRGLRTKVDGFLFAVMFWAACLSSGLPATFSPQAGRRGYALPVSSNNTRPLGKSPNTQSCLQVTSPSRLADPPSTDTVSSPRAVQLPFSPAPVRNFTMGWPSIMTLGTIS